MKNPVYVSCRYFATLQGVSFQRIGQLLEQGRIPGACKVKSSKNKFTHVIPEDAEWPEDRKPGRNKVMAPHGFLSLGDWAEKWGRSRGTAHAHIQHGAKIPGMVQYLNSFFVPENAEWPWNGRGRPCKGAK